MGQSRRIRGWGWLAIAAIATASGGELYARLGLGLGQPLLYEADPIYGYRVKPNQDVRRFGNRLTYNAQGLRNEAIAPFPAANTLRILCLGDSITYGGAQTDQTETYPYLLQAAWKARLARDNSPTRVEVLNASAGGWGMGNILAYLRTFGTYNSHLIILQVGSNDLFQPPTAGDLVGRAVSFPSRAPWFALEDGFTRYFLPKYLPALARDPGVQVAPSRLELDRNLQRIAAIVRLARDRRARIAIFLIEQPAGLEPNLPLYAEGKTRLAALAAQFNAPYLRLRDRLATAGGTALFRDGLHPNPQGNRAIAEALADALYDRGWEIPSR